MIAVSASPAPHSCRASTSATAPEDHGKPREPNEGRRQPHIEEYQLAFQRINVAPEFTLDVAELSADLCSLRTVVADLGQMADVLEQLTPGSVLIVTADHGQVHIGDASITPHRDVLDQVAYQSGEGRFRWLHARSGATQSLHATAKEMYGDVAWVVTRDETIDNGWFGPRVTDVARKRLGDVALVPFKDVSFHEPYDTGPYQLVCRHGSLTEAEMHVPLLAIAK